MLLLLALPAHAARVAGEPPPTRTVLPSGEACRGSSELTNTFAALRPGVAACIGTSAAPLRVSIDTYGVATTTIGDPALDACLATVKAPVLAFAPCTLSMDWPRWADPRSLPEPTPPTTALPTDGAILEMAKGVLAAGNPDVQRCANTHGAAGAAWKLELTVAVDGHVATAAVSRIEKANEAFEACILDAASRWRFAPIAHEQRLSKTLRFAID